MNVNTPIDYSSRYSFGHFCCRVKQGNRLSEFLQKYTDFGQKLIKLHGGLLDVTLNIYLKSCAYHPDPSAAPSFMGIWAIRSPLKIHWYTCISSETCWSRLIYTKVSSHRSIVINMYVITMAWRWIFPWSFHQSLQRRQEMDIFHICQHISAFWSKNNQKKTKKKKFRLWLSSFKKNWSNFLEDYSR